MPLQSSRSVTLKWKTKWEGRSSVLKLRMTLSTQIMSFCEKYGIRNHFMVPRTSQQNARAERLNRTLGEISRCIRLNVGLSKVF